MTTTQLDDKLECKICKTIQMDIPSDAVWDTPIHCSNCGSYLGAWGELQEHFAKQIRDAETLELKQGTIIKKS